MRDQGRIPQDLRQAKIGEVGRDKVNLDIFWLRDESLEDSANLPSPDVLAAEIVEDLKDALAQFEAVEDELSAEE